MNKNKFKNECLKKTEELVETLLACVQYIHESQLDFLPNNISVEKLKEFGLKLYQDADSLAYWPLFLDSETIDKQNITINVCSCSFGALALNNALESDERKRQYLGNTINRAINSLVLLQAEDGSWPSSWELEDNSIISGNVNQTTLSISTLFRCGFFDENSSIGEDHITMEQRIKRYSLLRNSLAWLINAKKDILADEAGWFFTNYNDDTTSIMITSFVYDVFIKTLKCMESNKELNDFFETEDPQLIKTINGLLKKAATYCCRHQNLDGGYAKTCKKERKDESSVLDTCYALNILCNINEENESKEKVSKHIDKAIRYIRDNFSLSSIEKDVIVRFPYVESKVSLKTKNTLQIDRIEEYEVYPYTLVIITLLSLYKEEDIKEGLKNFSKILYKLFSVLDTKCVSDSRNLKVVRGNRNAPGQFYPIYALYYTLYSYSLYLKNHDHIPLRGSLNYNPYLIAVVILLLSVVGIAFFTADIIFWVITSLAAYLFGLLIKNWKK